MNKNPLLLLESFGQSIWLDYLRRNSLENGEFKNWIERDGASGLTSNPSIFEKAIAGSHDYDEAIRTMALEGRSVEAIYQSLTIEDIQHAADLFRPTYDRLEGADGFVSLEVAAKLAHDTAGTIAEARQLWKLVNRPNLFIKVPATREGLPAIQQLIGEGINVNITLLFGLPRYREVVEAYLSGLEMLAAGDKPLNRVASVASFFLSRIDVLVDPLLEKIKLQGGPAAETAASLHGKVAIASAKVASQIYKEIFEGERYRKLAQKGARTQRLLWASTGTKNPEYSDVMYIEPLIGPDTINTVPLETLNAYRDHGNPKSRLGEGWEAACQVLEDLRKVGIDLDAATQQLEDEGVTKFLNATTQLTAALGEKRAAAFQESLNRQTLYLGKYEKAVQKRLASLEKAQFSSRLWRKDPSLWKSNFRDEEQIRNGLGWLHIAEKMEENLQEVEAFKTEVLKDGFEHVLMLGMGGSSMTALVFERTFPRDEQALALSVLDSTDPATILEIERTLPIEHTLFIVASKSGTTAEEFAFGEYFYQKLQKITGGQAGGNFCVITDPGTPLAKQAEERGYRKTFLNFADIGGRYSALSYFGLVPAALMGINISELLERALRMVHACTPGVPAQENPGLVLGAALGELAKNNERNKVTFLMPAKLAPLGLWLEQLLAESTGKEGKGLLPVAGETPGNPDEYGQDRVFVHIRMKDTTDKVLEQHVSALREAGQPVISIYLDDLLDLGQEFYRWEIATATAGSILGINAFDQPNVQESKDNTNRLLEMVSKQGNLPEEKPSLIEAPLSLYFEQTAPTVAETLKQFLAKYRPGDYLALMAYISENPTSLQSLQTLRQLLQKHLHIPTSLGYGPRFLHSTGQFHKGGPNTGLFLQLTAREVEDVPIPGTPYTFGLFIQAQALGDLEALRKHGRRVGRIDLGPDVNKGLQALIKAMQSALESAKVKA